MGSLQRSPKPRSWFKGALLLRGSKEKERGRGGEEREKKKEGEGNERGWEKRRKVETLPPSIPTYATDHHYHHHHQSLHLRMYR